MTSINSTIPTKQIDQIQIPIEMKQAQSTKVTVTKVADVSVKKVLVEITGLITYENDKNKDVKCIGIKLIDLKNRDLLKKIIGNGGGAMLVYKNSQPVSLHMESSVYANCKDQTDKVAWNNDKGLILINNFINLSGLQPDKYESLIKAALNS